jgi:hypothetical protein
MEPIRIQKNLERPYISLQFRPELSTMQSERQKILNFFVIFLWADDKFLLPCMRNCLGRQI